MGKSCPICQKVIEKNGGITDNVIVGVYQRGIFYTVSYKTKTFCSIECRDKWNALMADRVKKLRKKFLIYLAFVTCLPIFAIIIFWWLSVMFS
jgi:hypothetical protein